MSKLHPLLRDASLESAQANTPTPDGQPALFDRIDANTLQGALSNASTLSTLEKEGVPSHLLPAVAQAQKEQAALAAQKKKEQKPPPGRKAKAVYSYESQKEKELSFKKGDILDLTHTVDENWLEGTINDKQGIFPRNYVKVLTLEEYRELIACASKTVKAKYNFQAQSDKELSFNKGDVITIVKKIDDNWYEGSLDDKKGIFPSSYVELQ